MRADSCARLQALRGPSFPIVRPAPNRLDERPKVLVVDDDAKTRKLLGLALRRDYQVIECATGTAAITTLLAGRAVSLILCDVRMPVIDGVALHAWLERMRPELAERLVFVSAGELPPSQQLQGRRCLSLPCTVATIRALAAEAVHGVELEPA